VPLSSRPALAYAAALVGLIVTALAAYYAAAAADTRERLRFERAVEATRHSIETRLGAYIVMLRAGSGLFAAHPSVSRAEFRAYVDRLDLPRHYPGIQGIGFSILLRPRQLPVLVAALRSQGLPGARVWPDTPRPEYHAIIYLEPLDRRNRAAIGYDMFSEPVRRAAMERARDTGLPAASGLVTLVQEIDERSSRPREDGSRSSSSGPGT
jgi:CHASE1-domain containing sensor protein